MKHGTMTYLEEQARALLNAPHNPNRKIRPGWEDDEIMDDEFSKAMEIAIAMRKLKGLPTRV